MEANDAAATLLLGLSLAQYAGIQAAVALGFPLDRALANERLDERKWIRCRSAWGARLAREGQGSALSAAFRDKLGEATKWLGRRVIPLEDDMTAWMSFLGAYAADPAPSALLTRLGLRDEDVQRLVLAWKRRTDKDEALARKAQDIAAKGPRAVPAIQVFPGKLRPFPWSPGPLESKQIVSKIEAAGSDLKDSVDLDMPAPAVVIETPTFLRKSASEGAPSAIGPSAPPNLAPPSPSSVIAPLAPPNLAPPSPLNVIAALAPPNMELQVRPKLEPSAPIGGTVIEFELSTVTKALPFASAKEGAPAAIPYEPRPPRPQSGETALVLELPKGLLPFGPPGQSTSAVATPETMTSPTFELSARRDVPFEAVAAPPSNTVSPSGGPAGSAPSAAPKNAPKTPLSTGTVLAPDAPQGPVVPFKGAAGSGAGVGERMEGVDLAALVRAVRARGPEQAGVLESDARPGARVDVPPALTLEQHASLCAELAFLPERAAEVLARYGVTSETKRSLDALYTGAAGQKAAWETAYRAYHAWLVDARKNKR